jgi:heptosyltransferase-2
MTLPALTSLRAGFPDACVVVLAKPWVADVYRLCPAVDEIVTFQRPGRHDGAGGMLRLAGELRGMRFDAAVLLQNAIEAAIIARLARIPVRAGFDSDVRGWLLTHSVRRTPAIRAVHQTSYYLEMVKALGCPDTGVDVGLTPKKEDRLRATSLLDDYGLGGARLVGMAPGATYGAAKKWHPERFAALADRLSEARNVRVCLFGSQADRESTQAVLRNARRTVTDLAGKTGLRDAMALMARCDLFVSNDSGLMHVARPRCTHRCLLVPPTRDTGLVAVKCGGQKSRVLQPLPEENTPHRFSLHGTDFCRPRVSGRQGLFGRAGGSREKDPGGGRGGGSWRLVLKRGGQAEGDQPARRLSSSIGTAPERGCGYLTAWIG